MKRKMIKIVCPGCEQFLAYIPVDSDLYCPKCARWIYDGRNTERQNWRMAAGRKAKRKSFA